VTGERANVASERSATPGSPAAARTAATVGSPPTSASGAEPELPATTAATAWSRRELIRVWYLPLLAGLLPVLLIGFGASALANRLVFAGWALAFGAAYTALTRIGVDRGWDRRARAALLLATLAVAFAVFAGLVRRHHEIFDLGFRAVAPAVYAPVATRPGTAAGLAGALALGAAWQLSTWRVARRRDRTEGGE
jgi:hypothetical protein